MRNTQGKFICERHRVKVKVTGAKDLVCVSCSWMVCLQLKGILVNLIVSSAKKVIIYQGHIKIFFIYTPFATSVFDAHASGFYRAALNAGRYSHEKAVCLSVKRTICDKTKETCAYILILHERSFILVL